MGLNQISMFMRAGVVVSVALVLSSFAAGVYVYPNVPDKMPSHWNAAGQVDGYMPKLLSQIMSPAFIPTCQPEGDPLGRNL